MVFNFQQQVNSEDFSILVLKFTFYKMQFTAKCSVPTKRLGLTAQWAEHPSLPFHGIMTKVLNLSPWVAQLENDKPELTLKLTEVVSNSYYTPCILY